MLTKGVKAILAAIFLSTLLLLFGCSTQQTLPLKEKPKASSKAKPKNEKVSLTIVSPKEGETIKGTTAKVEVKLKNVTLTEAGGPNDSHQGHLHLELKSAGKEKGITVTQSVAQFLDVAPGKHTLIVKLAQNDHSAFTPPVEQGINFIVSP